MGTTAGLHAVQQALSTALLWNGYLSPLLLTWQNGTTAGLWRYPEALNSVISITKNPFVATEARYHGMYCQARRTSP